MTEITDGKLRLHINPFGARIDGLFYDDLYIGCNGATIGRFANRIGKGEFSLNGVKYELNKNENGNCLHGGEGSFRNRMWTELNVPGETDYNCAIFEIESPDMDMGFPGNLKARIKFSLSDDALILEYSASCDKDTVVNLTNHTYFNLNGISKEAEDHMLWLNSDSYLEVDDQLIPSGNILPVEGTKYDFRELREYNHSYDNCFVLNEGDFYTPKAHLEGNLSGIRMDVYTDRPAIQVFNNYRHICLETQGFPDSVNHDNFPSAVLKKGEEFKSVTVYRFSRKEE